MTAIRDALRAIIDTLDAEEMGEGPPASEHVAHWQKLHDDGTAALAALDAETPTTPADVGEEPVAWRWKQIGRTDADAWSYQFGHPQMSDTLYVTEPVYSATALERVTRERDALRARLETVEAETRERIAAALDEDADRIPCAEDAMVTRSNARLVRANFSYEDAERLEVEKDAARALSQEGSDA